MLMNNDPVIKEALIRNFGAETYREGILDRKFLAAAVFRDKSKLDILNAIVHPVTINDAEQWMKTQTSHYVLKEAALIFESGSQTGLDYVIGVSAPLSLKVLRIMKRDQTTREQVLERMSKQIDDNIKMRLCDFVIVNDEQEMIIPQVLALHEKILKI
jgi:dephospho-CoA kinase